MFIADASSWAEDQFQRKERPYHEKESYKWEETSRLVQRRMGTLMRRVISVCDRESDIYEYLNFKVKSKQRFVIRAVQNRRLADGEFKHLSLNRFP